MHYQIWVKKKTKGNIYYLAVLIKRMIALAVLINRGLFEEMRNYLLFDFFVLLLLFVLCAHLFF